MRGWIGMNSDITEQKNAAAALAQQAEQLQQQDRQKNRFLGLLGHELRNPLAAISNTIEVLRLNTLPADRQRQGIDIIHRQVTQLRCLVDDLLNISRINQGQIKLRKTRLAVADSLASAVEQIRPQIEARHHRLELELPEQPLYVEADPARLTQIVANLLSNAAHYTEDGGTLTLTARRLEDQALIRVRDTGMGIAPERLPHLFTAFGPMEATAGEHHAGLGMGLALARQLAELHGGSLEAASAGPGQGSEFTLRLPALPEGQIAEPAPLPADTGTEIPARRILLVEDEKAVAEALALLLQTMGQEVRIVSRGGQALEAVRAFRPELVLLDIGLPDMSGFEVARQLRQAYDATAFRLVALTGLGQEEDRRQAEAAGFDRHLLKPAGIEDLQAILGEL